METVRFNSLEEVKDYLSGDKITCLICGKGYINLTPHLHFKHNMLTDTYREQFNIPYTYALVTKAYSERRKAIILKYIDRLPKFSHEQPNPGYQKTRRKFPMPPTRKKVIYTGGVPKTNTELKREMALKMGSPEWRAMRTELAKQIRKRKSGG